MAAGRPLISNLGEVNMGIDIWMKRVETTFVATYRSQVWRVFLRILEQTPQYTGNAAANWNIGIDAPDFSFDPTLGASVDKIRGDVSWAEPLRKGDHRAMLIAQQRNAPKLELIKRNTRVYISNGVQGDDDKGRSSVMYLETLQDSAYWLKKLREVNRPYEVVSESVIEAHREFQSIWGEGFRVGGSNMPSSVYTTPAAQK